MSAIRLMCVCAGLLMIASCAQRAETGRLDRLKHSAVVEIDSDAVRIEIAHGAEPGTLEAHFRDVRTKQAIRLNAVAFEAVAWLGTEAHPLLFRAIQNSNVGERLADTSRFEAHLDRAISGPAVTVQISSLPIKDRRISDVVVSLPARTVDEESSDVL